MTAAIPKFELTSADCDMLVALHREATATGHALVEMASVSRVLARHLSAVLRDSVSSVLADNRSPYFLVAGLPIDEAPLVDGPRNSLEPSLADCSMLLVSGLVGQVFGLASVQGGNVVTDIRPRRASEGKRVGSDADSDLLWHTDNAYTTRAGDWIGLLYVRNDERIPTVFAPLVPDHLSRDTIEILKEPRFVLQPNRRDGNAVASRKVPILYGPDDDMRLRVNFNRDMAPDGDAAVFECLAALRDALEAAAVEVAGTPGDLLLLDNRRVAHRRPSFAAVYDTRDRWVKRTYIQLDRPRHKACALPESLVIDL